MKKRIISFIFTITTIASMTGTFSDAAENENTLAFVSEKKWNGHIYRLYDEKTTWENAKAYCESIGGHLATVTSEEEQKEIESLFSEKSFAFESYWLGANNNSGSWKWITNESFSYSNWDKKEPNGSSKDMVLQIYSPVTRYKKSEFKWDDTWNNGDKSGGIKSQGFICEFDNNEKYTPIATISWNGHTYQLYDESMTWENARAYCEEINGHLVTITSVDEQNNVEKLLEKGSKKQYWIGLKTEKEPAWITGEKYDYSKWDRGEPNNHRRGDGETENYVHIYNVSNPAVPGSERFRWNDMYIDNTYPGEEKFFCLENVGFICEIEKAENKFYADTDAFVGEGEFKYSDDYFKNTSYKYNHELARMSMRMAFAAYRDRSVDYKEQSKNIKDLLGKMNFNDIDTNDSYKEKPQTNSLGIIVANKKVKYDDGEYTLIAAAIRGGNYEKEWGGNFNVGTGEHHEGFRIGRDHALSYLTQYVKDYNIKGNIKIWITGYSRGAAVANLTAAYLNTHTMILGYGINMKPENIYAYCFETPAGTTDSKRNDVLHNNIYSIVNKNDFVPMVAPQSWGFGRYGITYFLPYKKTHVNYSELSSRMYKYYDKYVSNEYRTHRRDTIETFRKYKLAWSIEAAYPYYGFYLKDLEIKEDIGEFYNDTLDLLVDKFGSRENYVNEFEDAMIYFMETALGGGSLEEFCEIFKEELTSRFNPIKNAFESFDSLSEKESTDVLFNTLQATFKRLQINIEDEALHKVAEVAFGLIGSGKLETLLGNLEMLGVVHFPELCMAWIDSTDEYDYIMDVKPENNYQIILTIDQKIASALGQWVSNDVPPIIRNDRTMLPARFVAENLGAEVTWDEIDKAVVITKDNVEIVITIGSDKAKVNGKNVELDSPAFVENNRTYIPVRFLCESLGAEVEWNASEKKVIIIP